MMSADSRLKVAAVPESLEIAPGSTALLSVVVTNLSKVIDAYEVEPFGVDPEWVTATPSRVSLFPGESAIVELALTFPRDYPASDRQLAINVRSENDQERFEIVRVDVRLTPYLSTSVAVDPSVVTGGSAAMFGLVVSNGGNTGVRVRGFAVDPEDKATFTIEPSEMVLAPGSDQVFQISASGGRTWFGQPRARSFQVGVVAERRVETMATFVQRPRVPRWLLALLGLLTAAAVFAFVLSRTFDRVVEQASVADQIVDKALERDTGGGALVPTNPGSITGTLSSTAIPAGAGPVGFRAATDGTAGGGGGGVAAVQIELFLASDTSTPVATAATDSSGKFTLANLGTETYKLRMSGAGYPEVWYREDTPGVPAAADATEITIEVCTTSPCGPATCPDETCGNIDLGPIRIGAIPVSVKGSLGADGAGATLKIVRPGVTDPSIPAVVAEVVVGPDGSFDLSGIPSPADYEVIVEKPGSATVTRRLSLEPGQSIDGIGIDMAPADGLVRGTVVGPEGALGGVTIVATDGNQRVETVSFTEGDIGAFVLRNLSSPGRYTVTASADGYVSDSQSVVLVAGQSEGPSLSMRLVPAFGRVQGTVLVDDLPSGDVAVTITGPDVEQTTNSESATGASPGRYEFQGLPTPGIYTITFELAGTVPEVRTVQVPAAATTPTQVELVNLRRADATIVGSVIEEHDVTGIDGCGPGIEVWRVGGVEITLTDGNVVRRTFTTTPLTTPTRPCGPEYSGGFGDFVFSNVPPGTYTLTARREGSEDAVRIVEVIAGQEPAPIQVRVAQQASIGGTIQSPADCALRVRLYRFDDFGGDWERETPLFGTDYLFEGVDAPQGYMISVNTLDSETPIATTSVTAAPSTATRAKDITITSCGARS